LALEQWIKSTSPVKQASGNSPDKLPAGRFRTDRFSAGNIPAKKETPVSLRKQVWMATADADFASAKNLGAKNFSIADEQSMASAEIVEKVLITRLV
jgi:hypothetical protein